MTFHFAFFRGASDWRWRDIHTLCLRSCQRFAGAQRIVVHYDRADSGPVWDEAWALPNVEWRQVECPTSQNGQDFAIGCDIFRLQTLWESGGWFADLDFVFLKSFEVLRDADAVIGTQCKQKCKLSRSLIGSVPGSAFIRAYLDKYLNRNTEEPEKTFWTQANSWPWDLSQRHPVSVLPRTAFYPVAWSNKSFWTGGSVALRNSYCLHLWASLKPEFSLADLQDKTCLEEHIRETYADDGSGIVRRIAGKIIHFD